MASNKGPYYTASVPSLMTGDINGTSDTSYPDLESSILNSSAQMYSLADGALHAHESSTQSQLEGLLQAATAAAGEESHYAGNSLAISARLKRKSQLLCHNHTVFEPDQETRSVDTGYSTSSNRSHRSVSSLLDSPNYSKNYDSSSLAPRKKPRLNRSVPQQPKRPADRPEQESKSREAPSIATISSSSLQSSSSDAKTAAVPPAALFRSPSSSSKKYTRPPMSKLYASLELSPENFLRLQASAKGYMLNNAYPDRRDCVGQRGKGDSELVRLKLWNCVRDFLDHEGHGKSFFGVEARGENGKTRSMIWPNDKNKIIGAVTPLLRRMVTNERQRQYAVETRRDGATGDAKQTGDAPKQSLSRGRKGQEFSIRDKFELQKPSRGSYPETIGANYENEDLKKTIKAHNLASRLDNLKYISGLPEAEFNRIIASVDHQLRTLITPGLNERSLTEEEDIVAQMIETGRAWGHGFSGYTGDKSHFARLVILEIIETIKEANTDDLSPEGLRSPQTPLNSAFNPKSIFPMEPLEKTSIRVRSHDSSDPILISCGAIKLRFTVVAAGQQNLVHFKSTVNDCPDYRGLRSQILEHYHPTVDDYFSICVLLPEGLTSIQTDQEWRIALLLLKDAKWMNEKLTVMVKVDSI